LYLCGPKKILSKAWRAEMMVLNSIWENDFVLDVGNLDPRLMSKS
jgi:hypothetical protein